MLQLFEDGVIDVAQLLGNGTRGLHIHVEGRALHNFSLPHAHGCNLNDFVVEHVESCSLGVENHDFLALIRSGKLLEISAVIVNQEVVGQHGTLAQRLHEVAGIGIRCRHAKAFEQSCPSYKVMLVSQHIQMGKQEFHFASGKQILARHLEMRLSHFL